MLTIQNISKLYLKEIREWKISAVESSNTTYFFHLRHQNGDTQRINIERNEPEPGYYEMWCWDRDWVKDPTNCLPQRLLLKKYALSSMDSTLVHMERLLEYAGNIK